MQGDGRFRMRVGQWRLLEVERRVNRGVRCCGATVAQHDPPEENPQGTQPGQEDSGPKLPIRKRVHQLLPPRFAQKRNAFP
jgi:hypothetical protein